MTAENETAVAEPVATGEGVVCCVNCGQRIEVVHFSPPEWRHLPTPWGNYRTRELYRVCEARTVATPPADERREDVR